MVNIPDPTTAAAFLNRGSRSVRAGMQKGGIARTVNDLPPLLGCLKTPRYGTNKAKISIASARKGTYGACGTVGDFLLV